MKNLFFKKEGENKRVLSVLFLSKQLNLREIFIK